MKNENNMLFISMHYYFAVHGPQCQRGKPTMINTLQCRTATVNFEISPEITRLFFYKI